MSSIFDMIAAKYFTFDVLFLWRIKIARYSKAVINRVFGVCEFRYIHTYPNWMNEQEQKNASTTKLKKKKNEIPCCLYAGNYKMKP
jgi:hypothetical protein